MMSSTCSSQGTVLFHGYVETTMDALQLIFEAQQGVISHITHCLNHTEWQSMIKSGAIFIFSVKEGGIRQWTGMIRPACQVWDSHCFKDGLLWSPSSMIGNFSVGGIFVQKRQTQKLVYSRFTDKYMKPAAEETTIRHTQSSLRDSLKRYLLMLLLSSNIAESHAIFGDYHSENRTAWLLFHIVLHIWRCSWWKTEGISQICFLMFLLM